MRQSNTHRTDRRFKHIHHGRSPKIGTAIANRNYGVNKYWKTRRDRAINKNRFQKYNTMFDNDVVDNDRNEDVVYAAWEAHIDMLQKMNSGAMTRA
tara:strand:+ start:290 stop:577 length:288 start_codon:yes stop_codon:yes gene_type:complete